MRITTELVKSFNPCNDRFNNYKQHYPDSDLHITDFLKLDKITYDDKIWVWKKVATINEAALFGLKCAESVLHVFENEYPNDKRPRLALDSIKVYLADPTLENKNAAAYAANAAANATAYAAYAADNAAYAANAAANAAAYAAYAADNAAYAAYAADNAANAAANAAAYAAYAADNVEKNQQEINIKLLIEIYEGK